MFIETALVRGRMPGGVGGQRREPLPTRLDLLPVLSDPTGRFQFTPVLIFRRVLDTADRHPVA